jgi:Protein of unknown function (DUF1580)
MIELEKERLISLSEAAKLFPAGRYGSKPHTSTIWRWITSGVKGVRLKSVVLPRGRATSKEAVQRFLRALTEQADRNHPFRSPTPTDYKRRQKQADRDEKELERMGVR